MIDENDDEETVDDEVIEDEAFVAQGDGGTFMDTQFIGLSNRRWQSSIGEYKYGWQEKTSSAISQSVWTLPCKTTQLKK